MSNSKRKKKKPAKKATTAAIQAASGNILLQKPKTKIMSDKKQMGCYYASGVTPTEAARQAWLADWSYRAARHMRNTENTSPLKWGVAAVELLAELRDHDPDTYDREVKFSNEKESPAWSLLSHSLARQRRDAEVSERKCVNCGSPATHTGEFSEGNESGGREPVCWGCAVTHRCHGVRPLPTNTAPEAI